MSALFDEAMEAMAELRARVPERRVTSDEDGILIAHAVAFRADCTRRRVGAVVVDRHGRVIGTGRNGSPPGHPGCLSDGACPRGRLGYDQVGAGTSYSSGAGRCIALHAEANALLFTDPLARRGGSVFITDAPCDDCAKLLAGSGLARAVWAEKDEATGSWVVRSIDPTTFPVGGLYD